MANLRAVTIKGYRSYLEETRMELRPLTLLYGRNNAGKSALLRVLPILADSVRESALSPFDLTTVVGRQGSFLDVLSRGRGLKRLELGLEWGSVARPEGKDWFELKYIDERDQVVVVKLRSFDEEKKLRLDVEAEPYPDETLFNVKTPPRPEPLQMDLVGLGLTQQ